MDQPWQFLDKKKPRWSGGAWGRWGQSSFCSGLGWMKRLSRVTGCFAATRSAYLLEYPTLGAMH